MDVERYRVSAPFDVRVSVFQALCRDALRVNRFGLLSRFPLFLTLRFT